MKRLLIVDDDPDLCELLVTLFREPGKVECDFAHSFDQVRARFSDPTVFDLAILDLNLGKNLPDGIAVYHWLKEQKFAGRAVFLTGHGRFHPTLKLLQETTGIDLLEKPAGIDQLKNLIEETPCR